MDQRHEAMAQALIEHCKREGEDIVAASYEHDFIQSARRGTYATQNPIGPEAINMTPEEFTALRALIYG